MFCGTYFLQAHEIKNGLLKPFKKIYTNTGARYMLVTSVLWSISGPLDKIWIQSVGAISWMVFSNAMILLLTTIYICYAKKDFWLRNMKSLKYTAKILSLTCVGWCIILLQFLALKYTLVVYVLSIKRSSGVFWVILGYIFFRESHIRQKLFAAWLISIWIFLIVLYGNI